MSEVLPVCRAADLEDAPERTPWLVEPLWSRAAVGFVAGSPKLGKTWLALDLALSVATATACLDTFAVAEPGDVLLYLAEDPPAQVRARLAGLCRHRRLALERVPIHVITAPSLRLDLERDRDRLAATVARLHPRLLVLDPLVRLHRRDENLSADVSELLAFLRSLQRAYDLAVMVVHHMRKNRAARQGEALRGSGDLHAWTDSALYLRAHRDHLLLTAEHRSAPAPPPVEVRLASATDAAGPRLEVVGNATIEDEPVVAPSLPLTARLAELLGAATRPLSRFEIRRALRVNNQRLGDALSELEQRGDIVRYHQGWSIRPAARPSERSDRLP